LAAHQFGVNPDMFVGNLLPSSSWNAQNWSKDRQVIKENLVLSAMA
jgi:hypothetical protein